MSNSFRFLYLDSIRGLAALIVVVHHYMAAFYPQVIFGKQEAVVSFIQASFLYPPMGILIAGKLAVSLFFILSGFVLSYQFLGEGRERVQLLVASIKRPFRLGGVVVATSLAAALLWHFDLFYNQSVFELNGNVWLRPFWEGDIVLKDFVVDILLHPFSHSMTYNMPLWTIKMELYGSILVFVYLYAFSNKKYRYLLHVFMIMLLMGTSYMSFFIGLLLADLHKHKPLVATGVVKSMSLIFFCALFLLLSSYPCHFNKHDLQTTYYSFLPHVDSINYATLAATSLFICALISSRVKSMLEQPMLLFFGRISYSLYAVHFLILGSLSSYLFYKFSFSYSYNQSFAISFIISMIVTVFLSMLLSRYIDQSSVKTAGFIGDMVKKRLRNIGLV